MAEEHNTYFAYEVKVYNNLGDWLRRYLKRLGSWNMVELRAKAHSCTYCLEDWQPNYLAEPMHGHIVVFLKMHPLITKRRVLKWLREVILVKYYLEFVHWNAAAHAYNTFRAFQDYYTEYKRLEFARAEDFRSLEQVQELVDLFNFIRQERDRPSCPYLRVRPIESTKDWWNFWGNCPCERLNLSIV